MSHVTDAKEPPEGFLSSSAPTLKGLELQEEETVTFAPSLWACLTVGGKPLARLRRVCICGRGVTPQSTLPPCEVVRGVLSCPLQAFPDITVMLATVSLELSAVISQKEKQMERPRGDRLCVLDREATVLEACPPGPADTRPCRECFISSRGS